MTFGWYGFSLQHPEDWAPVALSGGRKEGYIRLGSPGRLSLQVRWKSLGAKPDLNLFLNSYFAKLRGDARRGKTEFHSEREPFEGGLGYLYRGTTFGRGHILVGECGRVFVIEVASTKNDSLLPPLRLIRESFVSGGDHEVWSVLGLTLRAPAGLELEKRDFVSGRTRLWLATRGVKVRGERWAFADQLLKAHPLDEWSRAIVGAPKAEVVEEEHGLRLKWSGSLLSPPSEALLHHQPDQNQLIVLTCATRKPEWRLSWDWLTASNR